MQLPLFEVASDWRPPSIADLPSWSSASRVCIDVETCDPHLRELGPGVRRGAYIVGYSFALEDGPAFYVPLRHEGGDNVENAEGALQYLRDQAAAFTGDIVGANLAYDLDFLAEEGVEFSACRFMRDIQIADPLIYELHQSYSLQNIAERYGVSGKDERLLREAASNYRVDPKNSMWRLPARYVGEYATQDVVAPLQILRRQERLIDEKDLWNIYDLESRLIPVLVRMRRRGVRIDQERLHSIERWSREEEARALEVVRHHTGHTIQVGDVWRAEALVPPLEYIGVQLDVTPKTGKKSIKKNALEHIDHPVAHAINRARRVNKLRTTFAESVRRHITNGRIHCVFNQIAVESEDGGGMKGARFGRMSSSNPNLQQQPSRDDFAAAWRSIYVPDTDLWACLDYSQQEPRWVTHYAAQMGLDGAEEAARRYREDPKTDNHDMMTRIVHGEDRVNAMDKDEFKRARTNCKIIYLGLCYGEGGAKLCRDLGLPTRWAVFNRGDDSYHESYEDALAARARDGNHGRIVEVAGEEGQRILDQFNEGAPFIKQLSKAAQARARANGFVKTIGGRRCHFPQLPDGSYDWTHKTLNRIIQGSSADQVKTAMVELDSMGYPLQLQVHDEIDASVVSRAQAEEMAEIMRHCVKAEVPFRVDVELGDSWGSVK